MNRRVDLTMSIEDASFVEDALSYYLSAAHNNFGAGYQRGDEYDREQRRRYQRIERVGCRLTRLLEKRKS